MDKWPMTHRTGDEANADFREFRSTTRTELSKWSQFALGGLIAGLVAWGGISGRVSSLEVGLKTSEDRAIEDRRLLRDTIDNLRAEIWNLRKDLQSEREQRLIDQSRATTSDPHPVFPRGRNFDK